ncbi:MAG: aminotransferase class V-fold PLP-dependent enzyme [Bryobacteraceae bacterium]
MRSSVKPSRRAVLGGASAALLAPHLAPAAPTSGIYTRVGVQPFINLTATLTINGGTLTLPEVKEAMDQASRWSVNMDELMAGVGARLAELMGAEAAIVTAGCAAAAACATAACIAGADPEKMQQLPNLAGLKDEVIMPKQSRNVYDHAIRSVGVRIVEVNSRQDLQSALTSRTAMIAVLGAGEAEGTVRLEQFVEAGRKAGVPVLVDAAAELPAKPHPYLSRGADLVAHSGGKILRGPQCAGMLIGRKDLVRAAWINSAPHHAFGRMMKVGKEEIMGMLAAMEYYFAKRDIQAEYRLWESWYAHIAAEITRVPGVKAKVFPAKGASPFPVLDVSWDPKRTGITAGELGRLLLGGDPRIMSHAAGDGHSFTIRPASMQAEDYKLVARRLHAILSTAPEGKPAQGDVLPAANLAGKWDVDLQFVYGEARHTMIFNIRGNKLTGTHLGRSLRGDLEGAVTGERVRFRSAFPVEGTRLNYAFEGTLSGGRMSGEVDCGEYGLAQWSAKRQG